MRYRSLAGRAYFCALANGEMFKHDGQTWIKDGPAARQMLNPQKVKHLRRYTEVETRPGPSLQSVLI